MLSAEFHSEGAKDKINSTGCPIVLLNQEQDMALFNTDAVVATPAALQFCEKHGINPMGLLGRHTSSDWGELDTSDTTVNIHAVQHDVRVFSSYKVGNGKVWIITEADRSSTCLMLPSEY